MGKFYDAAISLLDWLAKDGTTLQGIAAMPTNTMIMRIGKSSFETGKVDDIVKVFSVQRQCSIVYVKSCQQLSIEEKICML